MSERIVMISGATGGLGTAVVDVFLAAGDIVVSVARSSPSRSGPRFHGVQADLTSSRGARDAVGKVLRQFGRIDVLVHVLGGFAGGKPVQDTDDEMWHKMLEMNLNAAFYMFREVLRPMVAARHGRIVAVGSRAGVLPSAGLSAYSVSKAALNMLVQTVAAEVKDAGITANAVLPSTIDTPANREWGEPEDVAKWVKPESIAQLISYLASDAASDVNGALVPIYGRA
jgi:NAD(P)-dependent dehydrogenase (short-subunit alcohol dehydrogenase family)